MKCPKCGKMWNETNTIVSRTYMCPFCGNNFGLEGTEHENIYSILKKVTDDYGIDVLEDTQKTNALLMDYAPHSEKERKLIIMVMREGLVFKIKKIVHENAENQKLLVRKYAKQLSSDIWITELAAKYAVSVIAYAMGIVIDIEMTSSHENNDIETTNDNSTLQNVFHKGGKEYTETELNTVLKNCTAIGYKALAANLKIKEVLLPNTISMVYPKAFLNCTELRRISFPSTLTEIGRCAFEGCINLENIEIPDNSSFKVMNGILVDKKNKKALRALNTLNIKQLNITNGIVGISTKAFDRCEVESIVVPMSVSNIEPNAFYLTMNLLNIDVDQNNKWFRSIEGVVYDRAVKILVKYPQAKRGVNYYFEDSVEEIGCQAFSCVKELQTVTFISGLRKIGEKAFEYCMNLENIIIPNTVEIIGDRAFQYCCKLKSVMLPRSIIEIGDCAFMNCESLETISIPKSVLKIGNYAFSQCTELKSLIVQENVKYIGDGAFLECDRLEISIRGNEYVENYCRAHNIKMNKI